MNYKISKELFKAVMKDDIFNNSGDWGQLTEEKYINKSLKEIDYNNFFFDCKEWALKQGYMIESYLDSESNGVSVIRYENKYISAETEQQAVFDACQWILNNKDRQ